MHLSFRYHAIDSTLVLPQIRSDIEDECTKISKGFASRQQVVENALALFSGKFDFFVKNIHKMVSPLIVVIACLDL